MKALILLILIVLLPNPAIAEGWSAADKVLLGGALTVIAIDWGQTRTIARNPDLWHEEGNRFFLGSHPSMGRVNTYFAGYAFAIVGIAHILPSEYRKLYLGGVTLYEARLVYRNDRIGIHVSF